MLEGFCITVVPSSILFSAISECPSSRFEMSGSSLDVDECDHSALVFVRPGTANGDRLLVFSLPNNFGARAVTDRTRMMLTNSIVHIIHHSLSLSGGWAVSLVDNGIHIAYR